ARRRHPRHRRARANRPARAGGRPVRACRRDRARALRARAGGAPRRRGARVGRPLALDARRVRRPCARRRAERPVTKPRLLFVARTRYALPLSPSLERKFGALRDRFELRVLATAADGRAHDDGTFRLVGRLSLLDGPLFYLLLPARVRRITREHRPVAIVTQSPYEAAFVWLARTGARIVVELHGDWRTATRLYGSPLRRALSPLADAVGTFGLRRAAAVRTISSYTTGLVREVGVEPAAEFPAFMDLEVFSEREPVPLPPTPAALFVGVLELYKNVDGLARVWRL